jgi:hypothetical protein
MPIDYVHARDDMTNFHAPRDDSFLVFPSCYDGEEHFHDDPIGFMRKQFDEFIRKLEKLRGE